MKHKLTVLVAISAALTLAGCSQTTQSNTQSSQSSQSSQSKTSKVAKNSSDNSNTSTSSFKNKDTYTKLSASKMDYKTTASAIAVYAAQKYGDTWEIAVNAAKQGNLGVAFRSKDATGITSDNDGYVYEVSGTGKSSNARYMLAGDGADKQVAIFVKQRNLGTTSLKDIVAYLNQKNDADLVKQLAEKTQLNVKLAGDEDTQKTTNNSSASVIPSSLQGTWYTADTGNGNIDTLTVTDNKINDEAGFSMNVKAKTSGSSTSDGYMKQTTINGISFYSFTNMGQTPGQGSTYLAPHTEDGQSVIVSANSNGRTNAVYWKSEALAKKNSNKQFSDLKY
ncbi:hypothetical protein [Lactobacillus helveticus]|uniref:hypothetical protein n=1 Tax=Lactobacillus helveticus TaxID=1587 RepID=UPI000E77B93F|nr:hypothetical protein [Lactobacillus helveticus]MCD9225497.1 hypothetical protein [Lactobacillus helveticus]